MKFTVTSWAGLTEVVDRPESATAALERVLMLLGLKRNDVRIFDEIGWRRTPADLCRLAAREVAMLPDESGLSCSVCLRASSPDVLSVDRRYLVATLARADAPPPSSAFRHRHQIAKSLLTVSSSSTCVFSAVPHICSTVIASRLARKVSPPCVRPDQ
jgi:hypothetical protein